MVEHRATLILLDEADEEATDPPFYGSDFDIPRFAIWRTAAAILVVVAVSTLTWIGAITVGCWLWRHI